MLAIIGPLLALTMMVAVGSLSAFATARLDTNQLVDTPRQWSDALALALADNMNAWHSAAVTYAQANPGFVGPVPPGGLVLPSWYRPAENWSSVVGAGGVVATYYTGGGDHVPPSRVAWALLQRTGAYEGAGIVSGGAVASGAGGAVMPAPAAVPGGAAAIVTVVG